MDRVRVAVIGGGISGLAAAWRAIMPFPAGGAVPAGSVLADPGDVAVFEGSPRLGGKLLTGVLPGRGGPDITVDLGAESMLARRPEGIALTREAGLGADLVHPAIASASVLARGRLHGMPAGTVMGVPNDPAPLRDLLDDAEFARVLAEPSIDAPGVEHDIDVATWVAQHFGPAVADRLVEPLLGGVYAGHANRLSLEATLPALWTLARAGGPVLGRLPVPTVPAELGAEPADPVFAGIRGGVGRLPLALGEALASRGVQIHTGSAVRGLERTPAGWRIETGPAPAPEFIDADLVIIAVPPPAAARLLARECPGAATELARIPMASVAVVAAVIPSEQVEGIGGSGILIPPIEGHLIKAATFSSAKWSWVGEQAAASGSVLFRISIGRAGQERDLQHPDDALAALAVQDLGAVLGRRIEPSAVLVQRWGGGLPQYEVGHVGRVQRIRSAVSATPGLAIANAALDGVGVPACIAAAGRAVAGLVAAHAGPAERIGP